MAQPKLRNRENWYRFWDWAIDRLFSFGVALIVVLASFIFLRQLAIYASWPVSVSWLLPVCLDMLILAALRQYRRTKRAYPFLVAILAGVGSIAGNTVSHQISAGFTTPNIWVVSLVGAVPGISALLIIHLLTLEEKPPSDPKPGTETVELAETVRPEPATPRNHTETGAGSKPSSVAPTSATDTRPLRPVPLPPVSAGTAETAARREYSFPETNGQNRERKRDQELVQQLRRNGWENRTGDDLAKLLKCGKKRALTIRAAARETANTPMN